MMADRETLVLVPGLLSDGMVWAHQRAALGDRFDVAIPDLTRHDSLAGMATHILDHAPERFSIAGHSMGGRVALEVWRQAPHRVARLALLDTGVHPAQDGEIPKRQAMLTLSASEGMTALADAWLPPMVRPGLLESDPDFRTALYAMIERMTPQIHRQQITALINRPDAAPLLPQIRCPVFVGVGALDLWSPPAQHEEIVAAIAGARLEVFEECGHMAPMEAPEAVSQALARWMDLPSAPGD